MKLCLDCGTDIAEPQWKRRRCRPCNYRRRKMSPQFHSAAARDTRLQAGRRWLVGNKEHQRSLHAAHRLRVRKAALEHYGSVPPRYACCGETEFKFLAIDHINGTTLRQGQYGRAGYSLCAMLTKQSWPAGYQVLCHNCNMAKGFYGVCPHAELRI